MDIMIFAIPVFFILIGIELLVERKHQLELYRFNDAVSNISCGITQQVVGVFYKAIALLAYWYVYQNWSVMTIPNAWWSYILLFIGIDCLYYWFHRYAHEISIFWGTHVVHHQSEDYNLSVALRQSAFQSLVSGVFYLPLAFLGFDPIPFLLINTLQTLYQFWIHTEAIDKMPRWFEYVFNTPSHHRVHHGRNPKYIDRNHGGTLIIFDRMFGTFQPEEEDVVYGVTKGLKTWNPVWANFDYYKDLNQQFWSTKGIINKWRVLIEKPGWRPEEQGGPLTVPAVDRSTQAKYHTIIPNGLSIYIFIHFVLVLGGTLIFLLSLPKPEAGELVANVFTTKTIAMAIMIIWSLSSLGLSADKKRIGFALESSRLVLIPLIINFIFFDSGTNLIVLLLFIIASFFSLACYQRFRSVLKL